MSILALPGFLTTYLMGVTVRRAALTAALVVSAGVLAACSGGTPPANLVSVSDGGCGSSWHLAGPGWHTFRISNTAAEAAEVDLINPASNAVYAEVESLGPGTTSPMRLDVGSGSYAFRCLFEDHDPITGPTAVVGGHAAGTPAIQPVTSNDLLAPARVYHSYVAAGLTTLAGQADALLANVRAGNLAAARTAWLTAHLTYERLGAAYDAFGDFDQKIDGRPDGLAGGVNSPQWTGFYRLEYVSDLNSKGLGTIYGDLDPAYDDCSNNSHTATSPVGITTGKNIGDLLNARNVTWGWFQGGFTPTSTNSAGFAVCGSAHQNIGGATVTDYSPHHEPFQYYKSTANPKHLPPSSEAAIGHTDQANHQYDLSEFYKTLSAGNMPAVSFLKAPAYQDGHAGYSNPIDEQTFLVTAINKIEKSKDWKSTAIVVTYDDSDGWYDHQVMPIVNGSNTSADTSFCSSKPTTLDSWTTRCGYGQRLPMLVISPWTRQNYISSNMTNTVSVTKFIEDNWLRGQRIRGGSFDAISGSLDGKGGLLNFHTRPNFRPVILNPETGEVVSG
jgi:Phosphoesterase family/Imelysin